MIFTRGIQALKPFSEVEQHIMNKSVMVQVAKRTVYWFQGIEKQTPKLGLERATPEYVVWQREVKDDIRFNMDHVW